MKWWRNRKTCTSRIDPADDLADGGIDFEDLGSRSLIDRIQGPVGWIEYHFSYRYFELGLL
jgi:hypothetical protein